MSERASTFSLVPYISPDFSAEPFRLAPDACFVPASKDGVAPSSFHAMSIFPEYFKVEGKWLLAVESRMDTVPVLTYVGGSPVIRTVEPRRLKKGDLVAIGRSEDGTEGIYLHAHGFDGVNAAGKSSDQFAFRTGKSRETAFSANYRELYDLLNYEKTHGGYVVWVMGPAFSFDAAAKEAFVRLIDAGYVQAVLAGNALATHDLEGAYLGTALGQSVRTQQNVPGGHYHHLEVINIVRACGGIRAFLEKEQITDGIMYHLEKNRIPYVLTGSIRDDGPLPEVIGDVYAGQDAMRAHISKATTVICMATTLHSIATGNMTPSFRVMPDGTIREVYFYCVDIDEFTVNKLANRGSISSRGIVTNVQDFIVKVADHV